MASSAPLAVTDFGAVPDGKTDNSESISKAFAFLASHIGSRLHFPCSNGGSTYRVTRSMAIPDRSSLVADGAENCKILYSPSNDSGFVNAAFTITGEGHVTIDGLTLETAPTHPPGAVLELGRIKGGAGANKILNSTIRGYVTKAVVYSESSENNIWQNDTFRLLGGGGIYGFYTSAKDDLNICPGCQVGSNLSLYLQQFTFVAEAREKFVAICDQIGGGTGDHYYQRGYIGLNQNPESVGFEFVSGAQDQGGPNSAVDVRDVRVENGGFGFYFKKNQQPMVSSVNIDNVTWSSGVAKEALLSIASTNNAKTYFAFGENGLTLSQFTMSHNLARQHSPTGPSSFDSLINSTLEESYGPITIRVKASGNIFNIRQPGTISVQPAQRAANSFAFPSTVVSQ